MEGNKVEVAPGNADSGNLGGANNSDNNTYNNGSSMVEGAPSGAVGTAAALEKPKRQNKKKLAIILTIVGVVIVGLVIAILAVVINNKKSANNNEIAGSISYEEAQNEYTNTNSEILSEIVNNNVSGEDLLKLYEEKIAQTGDETAKALLELDYYMSMTSIYPNPDDEKKKEVLDGLVRVEEILQDMKSAEMVANAAFIYHDEELYEKYVLIAQERGSNMKTIDELLEGVGQ